MPERKHAGAPLASWCDRVVAKLNPVAERVAAAASSRCTAQAADPLEQHRAGPES